MVVYYDLIILMNFIYQFGVFGITNQILHMGIPLLRIVCASIAGCMAYVLLFMLFYQWSKGYFIVLGISFLMNLLITALIFQIVSIEQLVRVVVVELFVCIGLYGILDWLIHISKQSYLILTAIMALLFLGFSLKSFKMVLADMILQSEHKVEVVLVYGKKENACIYSGLLGLVDTGNALKDPISGMPVCIMTKELCQNLLQGSPVWKQKGYRVIPYSSVGKNKGILEAFLVDEIQVIQRRKRRLLGIEPCKVCRRNVLFAVRKENLIKKENYDVILNPKVIA